VKDARLLTGIRLHLQRLIILPGNVEPPWNPHDSGRAICFALQFGSLVLCRVPGIRNATAFRIQRYSRVSPLLGNILQRQSSVTIETQ
jgi:hypothetical protein